MRFYWLARTSDRPANSYAVAELRSDQAVVGMLAVWNPHDDHPADAVKIDGRAIDPHGDGGSASLALVAPGDGLPFDDPAVLDALRVILALPFPAVLSTFVVSDNECCGAITLVRDMSEGRLDRDPFAFIFGGERLTVSPGLFGSTPPPTGPVVQRYGSSTPWPGDQFPEPG